MRDDTCLELQSFGNEFTASLLILFGEIVELSCWCHGFPPLPGEERRSVAEWAHEHLSTNYSDLESLLRLLKGPPPAWPENFSAQLLIYGEMVTKCAWTFGGWQEHDEQLVVRQHYWKRMSPELAQRVAEHLSLVDNSSAGNTSQKKVLDAE